MIDTNSVKVRVKGEYACFTQPALKVERMTYPLYDTLCCKRCAGVYPMETRVSMGGKEHQDIEAHCFLFF